MTTLEALLAACDATASKPGMRPRPFLIETIASEIDRCALGSSRDCVELAATLGAIMTAAGERLRERGIDWRYADEP
jgi:hypothetical protein